MTKRFPKSLRVLFFNNVDIKIRANSLLDDFGKNYIIFVVFYDLGNSTKFDA